MPQVTIYLPEDVLAAVKTQAAAANLSVSSWFANLARKNAKPGGWPPGYLESFLGDPLEEPDDPPPEPIPGW